MFDLLIVGGGVSALSLLYELPEEMHVLVLQNDQPASSMLAQGGIATSLFEAGIDQHVEDTFQAGCHQGDIDVIRDMITTGNAVLQDYMEAGIPFDRKDGRYELALEAAHSVPRILHMKDRTGQSLCQWLGQRIRPEVTMLTGDLLEVLHEDGHIIGAVFQTAAGTFQFDGDQVVLATGGASGLYPVSTNRSERSAIPLILAREAGCRLVDMAYFQFHPTLLDSGPKNELVSEAVRGAGGQLVNQTGERIMEGIELAPRDVVARAIYARQLQGEKVYLDISRIAHFSERFPAIRRCLDSYGLTHLIPVTPGAHYMIGGIEADTAGRTAVSGLFAIGEASCTGFHGSNRLASNSLLEGLAMGRKCAAVIRASRGTLSQLSASTISFPAFRHKAQLMDYCGIYREEEKLKEGLRYFSQAAQGPERLYQALCLEIIQAALKAPSSGVHYIIDKEGKDESIISRRENQDVS
ncbi:L-aspartate oxidase [Macrococcus bovicus]|uniref:L-aspartate oxidase n=1 Tax=Macrococcus bovicus TaxID=69968 RepID=UPI0025A662F4|nr:FAD-binding protein [Macrococcus bovicus]WJP97406.1 FAD-binding protein [Macrococcus bovicus]